MAKAMSANKLGHAMIRVVVPMAPERAQVNGAGRLHLGFAAGAYVVARAVVPPSRFKAVMKALHAVGRDDPSYSDSGSKYWPLVVKPVEGQAAVDLYLGATLLQRVWVDPEAEMISSDESLAHQMIEQGDESDEGDGGDETDPDE